MSSHLHAVTIDARDPEALGTFWAGMLGREARADTQGGVTLPPPAGTDESIGYQVRFVPSDAERVDESRTHFDLTSDTDEQMQETIQRALRLGGRLIDVGQLPEEGHEVLADPEGNEFCVIPAGNNFLSDTDVIGAINRDGSQAVGYFWSKALNWPLVWDEDEETAIQAPSGGSKMSWGGPPVAPKTVPARIRLELVTDGADADAHDAEVARLITLGASRLAPGARVDVGSGPGNSGDAGGTVLVDPDGNEFSLLPARSR